MEMDIPTERPIFGNWCRSYIPLRTQQAQVQHQRSAHVDQSCQATSSIRLAGICATSRWIDASGLCSARGRQLRLALEQQHHHLHAHLRDPLLGCFRRMDWLADLPQKRQRRRVPDLSTLLYLEPAYRAWTNVSRRCCFHRIRLIISQCRVSDQFSVLNCHHRPSAKVSARKRERSNWSGRASVADAMYSSTWYAEQSSPATTVKATADKACR